MLAPVVVFGFNRPKVFRETIEALRRNSLALDTNLYIFIDGPRNDNDVPKVGDVITVKESSRNLKVIKEALEAVVHVPGFVEVDPEKLEGKYLRLPERSELNQEINEQLIVEFYNR